MEDVLSAQFDRVEKALSTLVDSIAAYNPSPQAALDLVAADDELSQGLDQRKSTRCAPYSFIADALQSPGTKQTMPASRPSTPKLKLSRSSSRPPSLP
jgi:hypothetical protein